MNKLIFILIFILSSFICNPIYADNSQLKKALELFQNPDVQNINVYIKSPNNKAVAVSKEKKSKLLNIHNYAWGISNSHDSLEGGKKRLLITVMIIN